MNPAVGAVKGQKSVSPIGYTPELKVNSPLKQGQVRNQQQVFQRIEPALIAVVMAGQRGWSTLSRQVLPVTYALGFGRDFDRDWELRFPRFRY